jgi:hypothetical protein
MEPIQFPQFNDTLAEDQPQYKPLPVYRMKGTDGIVISCWKMSWRERFRALWFGRIYVCSMTFNKPLQPLKVITKFEEAQ